MSERRDVDGGLRAERRGAAVWITIDRPARSNALDRASARALVDELEKTHRSETTRAVVLTGSGERAFCAGFDLDDVAERAPLEEVSRVMRAVERCPVPVIACLNGDAIGMGLELASRCDLRVVHPRARVGLPAVRLGIGYRAEGVRMILNRAPGLRAAMITGAVEPAQEVPGFADLVSESVREATSRLVDQIAANGPGATGYATRLLRNLAGIQAPGLADDDLEADRAALLDGPEHHAAIAARRMKRGVPAPTADSSQKVKDADGRD